MSFIRGKPDAAAAAVVAAVEAALFGGAIVAALALWPDSSHSTWEFSLAIVVTAMAFITLFLLIVLGVQFFFSRETEPPPPDESFYKPVDQKTFKKLTGQGDGALFPKEVPHG